MGYAWDLLAQPSITRVMRATQDVLTLPMPLLWWDRAAKPAASDDELTLKWQDYVFMADIISADASALTRDAGSFTYEQHKIAKIKHGVSISESMVQTINRIEKGNFGDIDILTFNNWMATRTRNLILGCQQRAEAMLNGMFQDNYSYDRLGIKFSGTFGMPADCKFNPLYVWSDTVNAKPMTDLTNVLQYMHHHHAEMLGRITMNYAAMAQIVATQQFINFYRATGYSYAQDAGNNAVTDIRSVAPLSFTGMVGNFLSLAVGFPVNIEVDEGQVREWQSNGSIATPVKLHPDTVIYFSNPADDHNSGGWDFGNGVIMESIIGQMGGTGVIGGFPGEQFGPIAYTTQADMQLNPPGLMTWAVMRGGPRKHRDTCTAKLTIG